MKKFNNDLYINDFNFFSSKIKLLVENDISEILYNKNSSINYALYNSLFRTSNLALTSEAKRIRPMICYWLFRNYYLKNKCDNKLSNLNLKEKLVLNKITNIALAIEILHCASLVIDDIEDGSKERRGQKSLHIKFGIPHSLNTGNWMYFLALKYVPQSLKNSAIETLFECHIGQALDLSSKDEEMTPQQFEETNSDRWAFYQKCAELKTSRLIKFAFESMKNILKINSNEVKILENIFENYGIIYQIFDDIRNFIPKMSNNKLHEDLNSGLRSSVVLSFLELLSVEEKKCALDELKKANFPRYFLSHQKKYLALEKCFFKAKNILSLNSTQLNSLNFHKSSRDYLSEIIEKPFEDIEKNILSMIHHEYNKPLINENITL